MLAPFSNYFSIHKFNKPIRMKCQAPNGFWFNQCLVVPDILDICLTCLHKATFYNNCYIKSLHFY